MDQARIRRAGDGRNCRRAGRRAGGLELNKRFDDD